MEKFKEAILVFGLAGLAGMIRHQLSQIFPGAGTIVVINFLGIFCLIYFVKVKLSNILNKSLLTGIGVGFLGGFTTLASPLLDMIFALKEQQYRLFFGYLFIHLLGGLVVAQLAYALAKGGHHD